MSDTPPVPPSIPAVLWALAGLIFRREALLMVAACVVLVATGGASVVWAQSRLDGGVAPVRERVEALERQVREDRHATQLEAEELRRRMANVERSSYETALNVRLLLEERRIQPVTLDLPVPSRDGGP